MISVNERAVALAERMIADPDYYKVKIHRILGSFVIDAGVEADGGYEAAKLVTEILFGGLNQITIETFPEKIDDMYFDAVHVHSDYTVLQQAACNISGWELRPGKFAPVLAGPGRCVARKEGDWCSGYTDYSDRYHRAVLTVEKGEMVSEEEVKDLMDAAGVEGEDLIIIVAASGSCVCSVEVAARILEQTLHRLHEEKFPLESIVEAHGICVIPPVIKNDLVAMGRLNDVLIYGGQSTFTVDCEDAEIEAVIGKITSDQCPEYGRMFQELYQEHGCDFYQVPMQIYSPAKVLIINQRTGHYFKSGKFNLDVLKDSFQAGVN